MWEEGWRESHLGRVPPELLAHRTSATFRSRAADRVASTIVAMCRVGADESLAGFVTVIDDEVEQLYVDRRRRGQGVADHLLGRAEELIAIRFDAAWLAVVDDNGRARAFYERCGWHDAGHFDNPAETTDGTILVPCRRYEKRVGTEGPDA